MTPAERLAAVRAELARQGVDGALVPRSDAHLGEYVPASAERLAWLTGFTGSAGLAIVLADRAAVFTDGRYTTQLAQQTDPALWERRHVTEEPPAEWLKAHAAGRRIGYDPWLHPEAALERFDAALEESVLLHQRSDVPYGMFLSGGTDSAAVLAMMARLKSSRMRPGSSGSRSSSITKSSSLR